MTRPRTSSGRTEVIFALSLTPNSQLHQFPIQRARGRTAEGDGRLSEREEGRRERAREADMARCEAFIKLVGFPSRRTAAALPECHGRSLAQSRSLPRPCSSIAREGGGETRGQGRLENRAATSMAHGDDSYSRHLSCMCQ